MPQRGRKSSASAAIKLVPPKPPPAPKRLSDAERRIWRDTFASVPANYIGREAWPLVESLAVHTAAERDLTARLHEMGIPEAPGGVKIFTLLSRARDAATGRITSLRTKLRLTSTATTRADAAGRSLANKPAEGQAKPWADSLHLNRKP